MNEKLRVLYVDDEIINTQLFKINFDEQYSVFVALNGNEGLSILHKNPEIILIISDMKMPGMSGIEFIREAKKEFPQKKFFILTGFDITSEIKKALSEGLIDEYFQKPFDIDMLERNINKYIKL